MKHKFRVLSLIMVFALAFGSINAVPVYADQTESQNESTQLTSLAITDLAEPVAGQPLDGKATVTSAEGVTWEIPVIWVDDTGVVATVAQAGHKYFPTFAFYVPSGYTVKGRNSNGAFSVSLPGFVTNLMGAGNLLFVADESTGITYLTWTISGISGIPATYAAGQPGTVQSTEAETGSGSESNSSSDETDPFWEATVHCGPNTLNKYGAENLAWLVALIKHEIQPRAVGALLDGFPAFSEAAKNNLLGDQISLYVYDVTVDKPAQNQAKNVAGCLAYVNGSYNNGIYEYQIGVNIDGMLELKNGEYAIKDGQKTELENTLVHELMHGLMDDYVRTGMASGDWPFPNSPNPTKEYNAFPRWFIEGSATTVERANVFWASTYESIKNMGNGKYTKEAVKNFFGTAGNSIDQYKKDYNNSIVGSYVGGYLACVYLGAKIATGDGDYTSEDVRKGFNTILENLHNGESLDSIIKNYTPYGGLLDFENNFLKDDGSSQFAADLLNYYDEVSSKIGKRANGSILMDFETTADSPLEGRGETSENQKTLLIVGDTNDGVASTVDDKLAIQSAGSYHTWSATDDDPNKFNEASSAAAKPDEEIANQAAEIPVQAAETPVQAAETPVQAAETPVQATETAVQAAEIPVQAAEETPVQPAVVPVQAADNSEPSTDQGAVPEACIVPEAITPVPDQDDSQDAGSDEGQADQESETEETDGSATTETGE
ncbi:MAG: hypothetical protein IJ821_01405 [Lachnospiraceae bacterium]|nr:hypothetical protein [Lachnospiraceae bacterium]